MQLVIDSSLAKTEVALLGEKNLFASSEDPTLESLFELVESLLNQANTSLSELESILFCEGPGSTLGIRIACMAIRTWQKLFPNINVFAYRNLELAATQIGAPCTLYSRHKQHTLNQLEFLEDHTFEWSVVNKDIPRNGYAVNIQHPNLENYPYNLKHLVASLSPKLLRQTSEPDAFALS